MSMTVKAYLKRGENANAEIRRFVVDESVTSSYEYLSKKVAQVFPSLGNSENFFLSWKDSEGDQITFSSDDELMEALGQFTEDIFRVYVKENKKARRESQHQGHSAPDGTGTKGGDEEVFHPGVVCDGCDNRIRGPRFKCITCPDYDLCKRCECRGLHPEHSFVKFRKPQVGRSHHGGFYNRPGMFRPFGHPGWRHWWSWNQQQQQEQQQQQQQQQGQEQGQTGPGPSTQQCGFQGTGAPGPHGEGAFPMGPGPFHGPPPHGPPPHDFLKDIGATVAQMLDPLGIDVDIDIDHHGTHMHCGGETHSCGGGRQGRRNGNKGRRGGCRKTWAGPDEQGQEEAKETPSAPAAEESNGGNVGKSGADEGVTAQAAGSDKQKPAVEPMEMGETGSGVAPSGTKKSGANGSDDADWTMVDDGSGNSAPPQEKDATTESDFEAALKQMTAMGFDNEGGWLAGLLEAKGGDIGRVLDAIKVGNQPSFNVNLK